MGYDTYSIIDRDNVIAKSMPLETALILLKALFLEYGNDPLVSYTIEKDTPKTISEEAD